MADTVLVLKDSLPGWLTNTRFGHVAYILDSWDDVGLELMAEKFCRSLTLYRLLRVAIIRTLWPGLSSSI